MSSRYFVRPATLEDAISVASRLEDADRDEVIAMHGLPPDLVLPAAISAGKEVYSAGLTEDNRGEILFGIDPIVGDELSAILWMVNTPRIREHAPIYSSVSKDILEEFHKRYPILTNFIDTRNETHIRFIRWLGFSIIREIPEFGASGTPFYEFFSFREIE